MDVSKQLTLMFIHGAGGTNSKWRLIKGHIGNHMYNFIELPGHGSNNDLPAESIEAYAEYLNSIVPQNAIIVGHSMGGLIGIELAARNKNVKGLVLVSSHYSLPVHPNVLEKLTANIFPDGLFYSSYSKNASEKLLAEEHLEISSVSMETTLSDYRCCDQYKRGIEVIEKLNNPILALYGEEDRLLPQTAKEHLQLVNPRVQIQTIPGAGHYVMLEQSVLFAKALVDFVDQVKKEGHHHESGKTELDLESV